MIAGPDGAAWITESGQNAIARVDPKSREVKLFALPKGFEKANLNTATFDKSRHALVHRPERRLRPCRSGERQGRGLEGAEGLRALRHHHHARPARSGTPRSRGDYIARIDTATGAATVVDPPKPGVGPRRIWSDSKGLLWVSFWHAGELARYDPGAKTWKTYALPKSKSGCYSVYVDDKDKVWVTDFVANAILRFDPATEKFESFPSNKRGAAVRQMLGRAGEVWGAESGTDRLVVVRY